MKEVLLLNLKRNGDIFAMGNIIRSMKAQNPDQTISILVLKEFEKAAKTISGINRVFTIDRQKVLTYKKNKIFSDGFALNQFQNDISQVKNRDWDLVVNYSNDRVSTHLASLLRSNSTKHAGIRFNDQCNIEYSNEWSIVFNDILTQLKYSPINFIDTFHKILSVDTNDEKFILKTSKEYNESAAKNFKEIRNLEETTQPIKLVGIQLTASSDSKTLVKKELISLIDKLYMNPGYFPILLCAPTEQERNLVSSINSEFNNSLVSIEADFLALNSVLMNLDLLITPDTAIKHIADLCKTPSIEISLGEAPLFKQGTINSKSVVITPRVDTREFSKLAIEKSLELQSQNLLITHQDIFALVEYILNDKEILDHEFHSNVSVYKPYNDILGSRLKLIQGTVCAEAEIERITSRLFIMKKLLSREDEQLYHELTSFGSRQLQNWLELTKEEITDISKYILGTLRSVLQIDGSKERTKSFVSQLTQLCSFCESDSQFMRIAALRFRARLEAVNTSDLLGSAKEVEGLLYELKSDIQHQVDIVKSAQEYIRKSKTTSSSISVKESQL